MLILTSLTPAILPSCRAQQDPAQGQERGRSRAQVEPFIELSTPHGLVLDSRGITLRWRTQEGGPFRLTVSDEKGATVYTATTFGHQMRLLVGGFPDALKSGRTYRWRVERSVGPAPAEQPYAEFRILGAEETAEAEARYQAASRELGVGDEARQPEGEIALAKLYLKERFYTEAEAELAQLEEKGWDDPRIAEILAEIYRKTGRNISLRELARSPAGP